MKKTILIMITLLLVAAMTVGIVVYAVGNIKNESESEIVSELTDIDQNENVNAGTEPAKANDPEPSPAEPVVVTLEEYWAKLKAEKEGEPFTLEEIYLLCAELFKTECSIKFTANESVLFFLREYSANGSSAEKTIVPDPSNVSEDDIYAVFLASIDLCFDECTNDDKTILSYLRKPITANAIYLPVYVFSSNYGDFGYNTFLDYYHGQNPYEEGIHVFTIYYDQKKIIQLHVKRPDANLYEEYKAAAIANGVNIK